ncbi:hypothetical protein BCR34DRAFT_572242 [Clohesyomyces aquaticus]|uniref:Uncharacterized protein n=1 Tax=Clohesyomyces aquaticus TaxID=1231657 RepID=A0A1Y1Z4I8_9PLEO|nr:hypothetical protein BCR34DRAFT_572242 [Clohesyomyces aquaticus]
MFCINYQKQCSPQSPDIISPSFSRVHRSALILPNHFLSPAEAEELVRPRTQQPLFPPPDPNLLKDIKPLSPAPSDLSNRGPRLPRARTEDNLQLLWGYDQSTPKGSMPAAIARDPRRRGNWIKARAQHALNRNLRSTTSPQEDPVVLEVELERPKSCSVEFGLKRKHSAFIIEEELRCQQEDRVGTLHLSTLLPGDDVLAQSNVGELRMAGEAASLDHTSKGITSDPLFGAFSFGEDEYLKALRSWNPNYHFNLAGETHLGSSRV